MPKHRKTKASRTSKAEARDIRPLSRHKLWTFRFVAALGIPLAFVLLIELSLRTFHYGHDTAFIRALDHQGRQLWVPNNQFGWRFFGPQMSRMPEAFAIDRKKPPESVRILVLGESAAKGEPQPAFGMPRMLQAMLTLRHPGQKFEVVNCAMTAINSHAIREIAHDCARADADIWVIYMGNNEVVGPFGAGTVFSQQTPPLPVIRATVTAKASRLGQLLDNLLSSASARPGEWTGMKMFLEQQVPAGDARLNSVYRNFEANLADILRTGRRAGAGIVLSTVAVNLRDCAPFASAHRNDLSAADRSTWESLYARGSKAQEAGDSTEAGAVYDRAAQLDDTFAELRFRQGQCALASGQTEQAAKHFVAARNLDTLRFRCDNRLNELIRQAATNHASDRLRFADTERVFAEASLAGLPGADSFYEHVHLNFQGNYRLARTLAEQVEKLLPTRVSNHVTTLAWPTIEDCAQRLAWTDWALAGVLPDLRARLAEPPFIGQVNHNQQLHSLKVQMEQLAAAQQPAGLVAAQAACESALAASPDDPDVMGLLSVIRQSSGDLAGATKLAQRIADLLPGDSQAHQRLGLLLAGQSQLLEAAQAFARAVELSPAEVLPRHNLAQALWQVGRSDAAVAEYRRALKLQPNFALGWLGLGQVLEQGGKATEANDCYHRALSCRTFRAADLTTLARFCRSRAWDSGAISNYNAAIGLSPGDAQLRIETGEYLATQKRFVEAGQHFEEAVQLSPDNIRARQLFGTALGQTGRAAEAEQQFRKVLQLAPDHLEGKLNLGISLISQGRTEEARQQLQEVLQRSPTNALALRFLQSIHGK